MKIQIRAQPEKNSENPAPQFFPMRTLYQMMDRVVFNCNGCGKPTNGKGRYIYCEKCRKFSPTDSISFYDLDIMEQIDKEKW